MLNISFAIVVLFFVSCSGVKRKPWESGKMDKNHPLALFKKSNRTPASSSQPYSFSKRDCPRQFMNNRVNIPDDDGETYDLEITHDDKNQLVFRVHFNSTSKHMDFVIDGNSHYLTESQPDSLRDGYIAFCRDQEFHMSSYSNNQKGRWSNYQIMHFKSNNLLEVLRVEIEHESDATPKLSKRSYRL